MLVFGSIAYLNNKELNDYGITVDGTIIDCQIVKTSGACVVTVEFITDQGERRTSTNTLYKETNCAVGKKVKIQYSVKSNLTYVLE